MLDKIETEIFGTPAGTRQKRILEDTLNEYQFESTGTVAKRLKKRSSDQSIKRVFIQSNEISKSNLFQSLNHKLDSNIDIHLPVDAYESMQQADLVERCRDLELANKQLNEENARLKEQMNKLKSIVSNL
jgi:hypothetical protein